MGYSWQRAVRIHPLPGMHISNAADLALTLQRKTLTSAVLFRFNGVEISVPKHGKTPDEVAQYFDEKIRKCGDKL